MKKMMEFAKSCPPKVVLSPDTFVYFFEDLGLWSGILLKVEENLEQGKNKNDHYTAHRAVVRSVSSY